MLDSRKQVCRRICAKSVRLVLGDYSQYLTARGYRGDSRYIENGSNTASWTFESLPSGRYQFFTTHVADEENTDSASYTIYDDGSSVGWKYVDQRQAPHHGTYDGAEWENLGTFTITSGTARIQVQNASYGTTLVADAIRWVEIPEPEETPVVVDNADGFFNESNSGGYWRALEEGYRGDSRYIENGSNTASWTFESLPSGRYQFFTTHVADEENTDSASYTIYDDGSSVGWKYVDQRQAPHHGTYDGAEWESLGTFTITSGTARIQVQNASSNTTLVADAIRWVEVPEPWFSLQRSRIALTSSGR